MTMTGSMDRVTPNPEPAIPWLLRRLGARWRDSKRHYRMAWGELAFLSPGWALAIHLFGDGPHYTLNIHLPWLVSAYIRLPFLQRFAREPEEMMETWGISYSEALWLRWGNRYRIITMPWRDWGASVAHDVLCVDGTWAPYVGSWERDKEPDNRATATYPYRYLLRSGERQACSATIHTERREWRLRWLRWTRFANKVVYSIDVSFSDEVGERSGSWKGGTIGCGYDIKPGETPLACLRRMESERRFT